MGESTSEPVATSRRCENCGSPLLGEHCYACGQPTKGLVRHFSSIIGDFFDSVFNFDTRTLRTLGPLLLRPGYLSNEYFYGHRVRYVSPVRLFFFLCIAAFFALQLTVDIDLNGVGQDGAFAKAQTVEEVEKSRDQAVAEMRAAREQLPDSPGARVGIDVGIAQLEAAAQRRIAWLKQRDAAQARGETVAPFDPDADDESENEGFQFNGKPWDAKTNPLTVDWLPERANAWLNQLVGRAKGNAKRIEEEPRLLVESFLTSLPQTLFVLLPIFALLLKTFYLFKRRLYMEHLIVALHSHAFLCAALLLLVGFGALRDLAGSGVWHEILGWFEAAILIWMPIYLVLMQKRVYRQGWFMTLLKGFLLGILYLVLLSIGAMVNLAISVVAM